MQPMIIDILRPDGSVRCTKCRLTVSRYTTTGNIALGAICTEQSVLQPYDEDDETMCPGTPWGFFTVNTGDAYSADVVAIKDYSDGEGNLATLIAAGLVHPPTRWTTSGFATIPICELTAAGREYVTKALEEQDGQK